MEFVRNVAVAFCSAAVFTGAVTLVSGHRLEKSMRYITALILLCTVLSSFAKTDLNFTAYSANTHKSESRVLEAVSIYEAEYLVAELMRQHTLNFEKIAVTSTKNQDGCIIINEISIKGADDRKKTESVLKMEGIDCRVVFE